jgi:DNA invertase Pin-like site-specific DNA recombinase
MANVLASFAEYERRLIGQRTKDALEVLKSQGTALGRARWPYRPPCGHLSSSARRAAFVAGIGTGLGGQGLYREVRLPTS